MRFFFIIFFCLRFVFASVGVVLCWDLSLMSLFYIFRHRLTLQSLSQSNSFNEWMKIFALFIFYLDSWWISIIRWFLCWKLFTCSTNRDDLFLQLAFQFRKNVFFFPRYHFADFCFYKVSTFVKQHTHLIYEKDFHWRKWHCMPSLVRYFFSDQFNL